MPDMRPSGPGIEVGVRVLAALAGGYGLALLGTLLLARILPGTRAQGLSSGMMAFYAIWIAPMIWAFSARGLLRMVLGLAIPALLCGGLMRLAGA